MIRKIVHISDLHIRTFQLHELYEKQMDILLESIKEELYTNKSHLLPHEVRIVITGDIAHQKINISNDFKPS